MNKSLGDYNVEKSSSYNFGNIIWTMKNEVHIEKLKNREMDLDKKFQKSPSTNIIYGNKTERKLHPEKIFTIKKNINTEKLKNREMDLDKKFQNSSASNCNIKQGFKRPGR